MPYKIIIVYIQYKAIILLIIKLKKEIMKKVLELTGSVDENLYVVDDEEGNETYKAVRLFDNDLALEITSQNDNGEHPLIQSLMGKTVTITVTVE